MRGECTGVTKTGKQSNNLGHGITRNQTLGQRNASSASEIRTLFSRFFGPRSIHFYSDGNKAAESKGALKDKSLLIVEILSDTWAQEFKKACEEKMKGIEIVYLSRREDVLKRFEKNPFDFVLFTMPLMADTAVWLIRGMKEINPETRAVLFSDRSRWPVEVEKIMEAADVFIPMPMTPQEILVALEKEIKTPKQDKTAQN
jgi:ActR/RegA family two-component response regulator